jgi:hypothetical protein
VEHAQLASDRLLPLHSGSLCPRSIGIAGRFTLSTTQTITAN